MKTLTLYTKSDCHLCEDALEVLRRVQVEIPFDLEELDITTDEQLHRDYFERIPVVALDGEELFEYVLDEQLLKERLSGEGGRGAGPGIL